ncbi:MAG: hypothetical protein ACHQO8_12745 [Vicinamibacterales bacterium]
MRITFNAVRDGLSAIKTASEQFADAQWQVSSGRRVRVPSDDPASAEKAINDQAEISSIDAYTKSSDSASSRLSVLDSVLGDVVSRITQAQTTAQSAHGNTANQATLDADAQTLVGIRDAIAGDINTTFNGSYVFGGTTSNKAPYATVAGAWTYQGDATTVTVKVDTSRSVTIAMNGQGIMQGGDAADLLTTLDNLAASVKAGDNAAIATGIDALNRAFSRAVQAQSQVGTDEAALADIATSLTGRRTAATARLSDDQDANLADAITKMSQAQAAYQAALGAVSTANKPSLLDYLK